MIDRVEHVLVVFVIDQSIDLVAGGIGTGPVLEMLAETYCERIGKTDVKLSRAAAEDVNKEVVLPLRHRREDSLMAAVEFVGEDV